MKNKFKSFGLLVAFAIVPLTLASCGVDSEDIVGTWGCTHSLYERVDYKKPQYNETEKDRDYGKVITFNSDGTFSNANEFLWVNYYPEISSGGGTWMIDENKLILDRTTWTIKKLNKTTLSIVREDYYLWHYYPEDDWENCERAEDEENADVVCRYELLFKRQ